MKTINMKSPIIKYILIILLVLMAILMIGLPMSAYGQLPKTQKQGEITYITGGVGEDESKAIKDDAKNWSLVVDFSQHLENRDAWISQVYLRILDVKGNGIFEVTTDGPFLLINLPSGSYMLTATYEGITKTQKIQIVDAKPLRASLNWRLPKSIN